MTFKELKFDKYNCPESQNLTANMLWRFSLLRYAISEYIVQVYNKPYVLYSLSITSITCLQTFYPLWHKKVTFPLFAIFYDLFSQNSANFKIGKMLCGHNNIDHNVVELRMLCIYLLEASEITSSCTKYQKDLLHQERWSWEIALFIKWMESLHPN